MSLPWKILLALAVVLPLGGFVVGSLASAADDDPLPRQPIVLREEPTGTPPTDGPSRTPGASPTPEGHGGDDDNDDNDDSNADDDDDVPVVSPRPDEHDRDDRDDRDDADDDHGDDDSDDGGDGDD